MGQSLTCLGVVLLAEVIIEIVGCPFHTPMISRGNSDRTNLKLLSATINMGIDITISGGLHILKEFIKILLFMKTKTFE